MVGGRDLRDDAVDRADFDARSCALRAVRKHGTGSMGMGQDQEPAGAACGRDLPRVVCALVGLAAAGRRFHHHERSIGSKGGTDTIVAHVEIRDFCKIDSLADGIAKRH